MNIPALPRRTFLRGLGAMIALPMLDAVYRRMGEAVDAGQEIFPQPGAASSILRRGRC